MTTEGITATTITKWRWRNPEIKSNDTPAVAGTILEQNHHRHHHRIGNLRHRLRRHRWIVHQKWMSGELQRDRMEAEKLN